MDISNVTQNGLATSSVAKSTKAAVNGNSLPDAGQVSVRSGNLQDASVPSQPNNSASSPKPNSQELQNLVEQANVTLQGRFSDLKFTVAEGTDVPVVRIEDSETGELIRQVPSEAMVAIARALDEAQRGMMLEEKV